MRRWGLRTRLVVATVGSLLVVVIMLTAAYNLILGRSLRTDATSLAQERAEARALAVQVEGALGTPELRRLDRGETEPVWVVAPDGRLLSGPAPDANLTAAIRRTADGAPQSAEGYRLASVPLTLRGVRRGTVVASVRLAPFTRSGRTALVGTIALGLTIAAALAIAAWLALRAALRPVARMTADAAAWGEHDLERRFALGPAHDEITGLAATLDGLLGRLAGSINRERHLTSEISHELRTPLARAMAHAELGRRATAEPAAREAFDGVLRGGREVQRTLDALLAAARAGGSGESCLAGEAASQALGVAERAGPAGVTARVEGGAGVRVAVARDVVARALAPILSNAFRYAASAVTIRIGADRDHVTFTVVDDGPGIAAGEVEEIFHPGRRGVAGAGVPGGSGLGLPLARRLARAAGGDVEAVAAAGGGHLVVRLPRAL
ncbi:MAG: HAMP domain-containing sensor histidine kinase [Thermoleophilia bacterium]